MESTAIRATAVSKCYPLYERPADRLRQMLWRGRRQFYREFWALRGLNLTVRRGEVLGIVGRNGAGKSTLLQIICGTLTPSSGTIAVQGRIAALLELGAGFNPEFSGRENVFMNAAILGLTPAEIAERYAAIVAFAGIGDFIEQPVKTYSSGMYVRLAFAVATSVDPDILVIDEALSVGDGAFARKSFDRIMALKEAGKTILFCSHSSYQIEALCERALWLEQGRVRMLDAAAQVTSAYNASLAQEMVPASASAAPAATPATTGSGRIVAVESSPQAAPGQRPTLVSGESDLTITVRFALDPSLPPPMIGFGIESDAGITVSSASSLEDGATLRMSASGQGEARVVFERIPLLKGVYHVTVFLGCERGLHVYDWTPRCLSFEVTQPGLLQGLVALPHRWLPDD